MPEFITVTEKIERRTYLKGKFTGKFVGYLDAENSDLKTENFYDLEITEARVRAKRADLRTWHEGDEFEEFVEVERFLTKLPNPMACEIEDENGSIKHFNLHIHEPKLTNYELFNQLYEKNILFAAIKGEISGYLQHFDTVEKQIEVVPPHAPTGIPQIEPNVAFPATLGVGEPLDSNHLSANRGCLPSLGGSVFSGGGCLSLIGTILIVYLCLSVLIMTLSAIANLFGATVIFLSLLFSALVPIFLIGSLLYIFVRLQSYLPPVWKWIFLFLIAWLIIILLF